MRRSFLPCLAVLCAAAGLAPFAHAQQSKIILTSAGNDLSADGNAAIGTILDPDVNARMHTFRRGVGHTILGPVIYGLSSEIEGSADFSVVATTLTNGIYGNPQNPPFGYYSSTVVCCVGSSCTVVDFQACFGTIVGNAYSCDPNPCPSPATLGACCDLTGAICTLTAQAACATPNYWIAGTTCDNRPCKTGHYVAHRFTTASNQWSNIGSFPAVMGQGAALCDSELNSVFGISANGQFIVGSGNYGIYNAVSCDPRGFVYSHVDGVVRDLPPVGTGCQVFTQAEFVTDDGLIACGTDTHEEPTDPSGLTGPTDGICNARTLAVWERASATSDFLASGRTILDRFGGGGLGTMAMTPSGVVFANLSENAASYDVGNASAGGSLVRYQKISGVWTRTIIGKMASPPGFDPVGAMLPRAVSDDGSTVIGTAFFGPPSFFSPSRPFIWRATINGGVPIDFQDYLNSINGGTFPTTGQVSFGRYTALSADGNAVLVDWALGQSTGCPPDTGLADLPRAAILYLDGSAINCEPPRIVGGPYNVAQTEYTIFGIVGNVFVSGSYPMTLQWQKETPTGSNNWVNISNSCGYFDPNDPWVYEGTQGFQLRVNMLAPAAERDGNFRVIVSNSCGSVTSQVAAISAVTGACCYPSMGSTVCSVEIQSRCIGDPVISFFRGGTYLGDGVTCSPTTCDAVVGACCTGSGGSAAACTITIQPHCVRSVDGGGLGGSFAGLGTTCTPTACASVSGACCYSASATSDVVCTVEVQSYCVGAASAGGVFGVFRGLGTTCSPSSCDAVAGACCASPALGQPVICTIQTEARCSGELNRGGLQGIYAGNGQTCSAVNCADVSGACCHSLTDTTDVICTVQLQTICTSSVYGSFIGNTLVIGLGGVYRGDSTTCSPSSCTNFVGACCFTPFGDQCSICTIQTETRCTDFSWLGGLQGTFGGIGSVCSPTTCPGTGPGACCAGTTCIIAACSAECVDTLAGFYQGAGSTCGPAACTTNPSFVCCRGSTCAVVTQSECNASGTAGAIFVSGVTACGFSQTTPCCIADFNKTGGVSIQDIFDYLNAWFANSPFTDTGSNGTTAPDVQSIFDFLNAWFAGGC